MKQVIYHYDYCSYGGYSPNSVNLGDYIQSIAAAQFFDSVDGTVDRDSLSSIEDPVKVIGNGWYYINKGRHELNRNINLLPVAIHIQNRSPEVVDVMKSFSKKGPIGCRDLATLDFLRKNNIESYFSSCLTTTLQRSKITSEGDDRRGIIFSDIDESSYKLLFGQHRLFPLNRFLKSFSVNRMRNRGLLLKRLTSLVKYYDGESIERVTHLCSLSVSHEARFNLALNLLKKYASARCVFTSRIHCALPCLALGTPVVLVVDKFDALRYRGLDSYFNYLFIDDFCELKQSIETLNGEIVNKDLFQVKANELKKRCCDFVKAE